MATFHIEHFGCRATQADAAAIERQLLERGFLASGGAAHADVDVMNTCMVTASADMRARQTIRAIHRENPAARIVVTGCYAQRAPEELAGLEGVVWVVGNSHKPEIPRLIDHMAAQSSGWSIAEQGFASEGQEPRVSAGFVPLEQIDAASRGGIRDGNGADPMSLARAPAKILTGNIFEQSGVLVGPILGGEGGHTRPVLKIQDGCNNRCAYCVIPFVRGRSRSLPPAQVVEEIRRLSAAGYREVVLSGINLGSYGRDLNPRVEFGELLRRVLEETSLERLRISSIEPMDVTEDLIALFASTDRIAQHFHIPLQSGSDRILAAMHRWYRAEHYARRVQLIRERLPHAAIGADVIAGFPGETEDEHTATLAFIESLPFTYLHVFSYSKRPGTKAAALTNEIPSAIIKGRARELRSLGEKKAAAFRQSQIGRTLRVLTLRSDRQGPSGATPALSTNYLKVRVRGTHPANRWLDVCISNAEGNYLLGDVAQAGWPYASKMTCASA